MRREPDNRLSPRTNHRPSGVGDASGDRHQPPMTNVIPLETPLSLNVCNPERLLRELCDTGRSRPLAPPNQFVMLSAVAASRSEAATESKHPTPACAKMNSSRHSPVALYRVAPALVGREYQPRLNSWNDGAAGVPPATQHCVNSAVSDFVLVSRFVIPKPRVFTSGARDLAWRTRN
jgi:hypothetical protein